MKKPVLQNAVVILGGYSAFALVVNMTSGVVVQYMPSVLLFALLATAMFMGYRGNSDNKKWIDGLFVAIPYLLGMGCYMVARMLQNGDWIKSYRMIVPAAYAQLDLMKKLTFGALGQDLLVGLTLFLAAVLTYVGIRVGMCVKTGETIAKKLVYNNVLLWGIHFYMMALLGQVIISNPKLQMDDTQRMVSGAIVTVMIFVVYFFIGKWSKAFTSMGLQLVSCMSVTLTALGMYVASLFLIYPSGRYEVYILPVAHSFFGVIGKELALLLGAKAEFISQYGMVVSLLLILMPMVLVCVGNRAARTQEKVWVDAESLVE